MSIDINTSRTRNPSHFTHVHVVREGQDSFFSSPSPHVITTGCVRVRVSGVRVRRKQNNTDSLSTPPYLPPSVK